MPQVCRGHVLQLSVFRFGLPWIASENKQQPQQMHAKHFHILTYVYTQNYLVSGWAQWVITHLFTGAGKNTLELLPVSAPLPIFLTPRESVSWRRNQIRSSQHQLKRLPAKDGKKNSGFCWWPMPIHHIQKNTQGPVRMAGLCQHTVPVSQDWQGGAWRHCATCDSRGTRAAEASPEGKAWGSKHCP